jgi:hypothetical protein
MQGWSDPDPINGYKNILNYLKITLDKPPAL